MVSCEGKIVTFPDLISFIIYHGDSRRILSPQCCIHPQQIRNLPLQARYLLHDLKKNKVCLNAGTFLPNLWCSVSDWFKAESIPCWLFKSQTCGFWKNPSPSACCFHYWPFCICHELVWNLGIWLILGIQSYPYLISSVGKCNAYKCHDDEEKY